MSDLNRLPIEDYVPSDRHNLVNFAERQAARKEREAERARERARREHLDNLMDGYAGRRDLGQTMERVDRGMSDFVRGCGGDYPRLSRRV